MPTVPQALKRQKEAELEPPGSAQQLQHEKEAKEEEVVRLGRQRKNVLNMVLVPGTYTINDNNPIFVEFVPTLI